MISPSFCQSQTCPSELGLEVSQSCPSLPPKGWAPGANVRAYIVSTPQNPFSSAQITAIETELANWASRLQSLNQGQPPTFTPQIVPVLPTNRTPPYAVFEFGPVGMCVTPQNPNPSACTQTFWCDGPGGIVQYSITNVKIGFADPGYQLFAHEIGHTFGLADCTAPDCLSAVTVMNPSTGPNTAMAPHCCDSKVLWRESGNYGQSSNNCSPIVVQGTTASPGTAFLTPYPGTSRTQMLRFRKIRSPATQSSRAAWKFTTTGSRRS